MATTLPRRTAIGLEAAAAKSLLEAYAAEVQGDDDAAQSLIEGETNLVEACSAVLRQVRETEALLEGLRPIAADIKERGSRFKLRRERLRTLLAQALLTSGRDKLQLPEATLSAKATEAWAVIDDPMLIPVELKRPQKGFEELVEVIEEARLALILIDPELGERLAAALAKSLALAPDEDAITTALEQQQTVPGAHLGAPGAAITIRTK